MAKDTRDTLPDTQEYLDALSRREAEPHGNPNHSEDCSFESFKIAADCLVEALSAKAG